MTMTCKIDELRYLPPCSGSAVHPSMYRWAELTPPAAATKWHFVLGLAAVTAEPAVHSPIRYTVPVRRYRYHSK